MTLRDSGPEYLLVDGYNIIFAWDELKTVARTVWMPPDSC